jgi:hypothetical protein
MLDFGSISCLTKRAKYNTNMRKRTKYIVITVFAVTVVACAWYIWPRPDPVHDRFRLVSRAMTRAEVMDIMKSEPIVKVAGQMLFWPGIDGMGVVTIDPETERATDVEWQLYDECRGPFWMRLWWRVTTALGV